MDNLVLIRVAASLRQTLTGTVFQDAHQEDSRFRLVFLRDDRPRTVTVSLDPDRPWVGRTSVRHRFRRTAPRSFAAALRRTLRGSLVAGVEKPAAERRVLLRFADGKALVLELVPRGVGFHLVDEAGLVLATARRGRNLPNEPYRPLPFPRTRTDPFDADPVAIDEVVRARLDRGEGPEQALLRGFLGIDRVAAEMIARESRETGRSLGQVVVDRLGSLARGEVDPAIEGPEDDGPGDRRLLPWVPAWPVEAALARVALEDPAATAGLYYERLEQERFLERRSERLLAVLESEIRGQRGIEAKVAADALRFEDPERFQRSGEALLAGLTQARRVGDQVLVPDPYDSEGRALAVEVPPGRSLTRAAQLYFERHRRARRGLQRSRERGKQVSERRVRLERLRERYAGKTDARSVESLARDMQGESIPIALERIRSGSRNPNRTTRPRLEGVRLFTSREGDSVLVGKSGKDNHRLTFRLAAPEDFWLHALGVRGAHVVVRNDTGAVRPRDGSLQEAAGAAAWFSEAREQALVDVQWTRRKYVRRIRGAPPGTVRVKRSETVRVKPRRPPDD